MTDWDGPLGWMLTAVIVVAIGYSYLAGAGGGAAAGQLTNDTLQATGGAADVDTGALESVGEFTTVSTSLGDAVAFDGDGYVEAGVSDVHSPDAWSVCTYAAADQATVSANGTETVLAHDQALLRYNGSTDAYSYVWFNKSSRETVRAEAAVSEANATKLMPVCAVHESNQLQVVTNTTNGTAVTANVENYDYPGNTSNWNGTIEETRGYTDALNRSQQLQFFSAPTEAVQGPAPAFRLTYDTRGGLGDSLPVYWSSSSATVVNATQVDGFDGTPLTAGSDYEKRGDSLALLSGGRLEPTGEVLYVSYVFEGAPLGLLGIGIGLFALAVLYIPMRQYL